MMITGLKVYDGLQKFFAQRKDRWKFAEFRKSRASFVRFHIWNVFAFYGGTEQLDRLIIDSAAVACSSQPWSRGNNYFFFVVNPKPKKAVS